MITRLDKNIMLSKCVNVLKQLRPNATLEAVSSLIPWGYHFVNSIQSGRVVGFGAYFSTSSFIYGRYHYLSDLVVDADYRSKGIGASLLNKISSTNLPIELDSGLEKIEAHRFYLRHGFNNAGYTVRLKSSAFKIMGDFQQEKTVVIGNISKIKKLLERERHAIQLFIKNALHNVRSDCKYLEDFLESNPGQNLLILKGESDEIEGILLFELQNRLYIGGECFHVSDLIVKSGESKMERENALLLALVQHAKKYNANNKKPVNSVIIELTESQVKSHHIPLGDKKGEGVEIKDRISAASITANSLFCATAKHFVRGAMGTHIEDIMIYPKKNGSPLLEPPGCSGEQNNQHLDS